MRSILRATIRIATFVAMLVVFSIGARAQEDTYEHFTVVVADDVPCGIIVCYYWGGDGVCSVYSSGTTISGGTGPFTLTDAHGRIYAINSRIGCVRSFDAGPGCCVDICYSIDDRGWPVITVTRANMPACPDL